MPTSRDAARKAAEKDLDKTGYYSTGDYMKNVAKAGESIRQKRMRATADRVDADYKRQPKPEAPPAPKAAQAKPRRKAKRKQPASSSSNSGPAKIKGKFGVGRDEKPTIETESTAPKEAPHIAGGYTQKRLTNLPTRSVPSKKRGKLRRAVSAVGRGLRKTGRALAGAGGPSKTILAKNRQGQKVSG
jgi:hypothetical protein